MAIKIYPYKQGSRSAKSLAEAVGGKVLKVQGSSYVPKNRDVIINWGASALPAFPGIGYVLNKNVKPAQCKLQTFYHFDAENVPMPAYRTSKAQVLGEVVGIAPLSFPVVCRQTLTGHSGQGIVIADTPDQLVDAPLYTQYVKKKDEYRIHVFGDTIFFCQRKARKHSVSNPNWRIRNLAGGFAFVEATIAYVPPDVLSAALQAIAALGLDFGGVDVILGTDGKAYVLEVNTACGLEERTAKAYAKVFRDFYEDWLITESS